jgi:hypothetical protein
VEDVQDDNLNVGFAGGRGTVESGSGALTGLPVTWAARTETPEGKTSPEELVAAARVARDGSGNWSALPDLGSPSVAWANARLGAGSLPELNEPGGEPAHGLIAYDSSSASQ